MCSKRTSIVLLSERFTDERGVVIFGPTADRELQGVLGELDWSVAGDGTMLKSHQNWTFCVKTWRRYARAVRARCSWTQNPWKGARSSPLSWTIWSHDFFSRDCHDHDHNLFVDLRHGVPDVFLEVSVVVEPSFVGKRIKLLLSELVQSVEENHDDHNHHHDHNHHNHDHHHVDYVSPVRSHGVFWHPIIVVLVTGERWIVLLAWRTFLSI